MCGAIRVECECGFFNVFGSTCQNPNHTFIVSQDKNNIAEGGSQNE